MNQELFAILAEISDEEQRLLEGQGMEWEYYSSKKEYVIEGDRLLNRGEQVRARTHTRFVDFPPHNHDYIEVMYVCQGSITHTINGREVVTEDGDLLFLNQYVVHGIKRAEKDDIGVNFIIRPSFFDSTWIIAGEDNVLTEFVVDALRKEQGADNYLHFQVKGNLQVENILENLIYSLVHKRKKEEETNQILMGLLFFYLIQSIDTLKEESATGFDEVIIHTTLNYVERNYRTASLAELAEILNQPLSTLSKLIKQLTGRNFKALLQSKRMNMAKTLLANTDLSVADIVANIGYENSSYFYRMFKEDQGVSPAEYRKLSRQKRRADEA